MNLLKELRKRGWRGVSWDKERRVVSVGFPLDREWNPMPLENFREMLRRNGLNDRPELVCGVLFFELPEEDVRRLML